MQPHQHFSSSYSHSQQAREYLHFFRSLSTVVRRLYTGFMRHISNGEYMHFFRSLHTVVPRLRRVHASYLKWRPVSRYKSLLFCKLRNPNEKDMAEYNLRSDRPRINYKALLEPKLPKLTASTGGRASRKIDTQLYPLPSPPPKQGCRRVPKSKQYTIAATSSSNVRRQALGSKQAQERSGSSSTKKYWLTRRH